MTWQISGRYAETCNCDYLCPCPLTGMTSTTHGFCIFAMGFQVERGEFEGLALDGRRFVVVGRTPGGMAGGDWKGGLGGEEPDDARRAGEAPGTLTRQGRG